MSEKKEDMFKDCLYNKEGWCNYLEIKIRCEDHGCEFTIDSNNPTYPKKEEKKNT